MKRVIGLDVFRGIVILSMIFVNYVAGMKGIPTFLEHEKAGIDNFTFADLIFPAFLLMVGVSIPLGLGKRIERNEPLKKSLAHIFTRTAALLVMGVVLVEPWAFDPVATGMPAYFWFPLFYIGAALFLVDTKPFQWIETRPRLKKWLKGGGLYIVAVLLLISQFDYQDGMGPGPIRTSWWGILGMIGWCYLPNALIWNAVARQRKRMRTESSLLDTFFAVFVLELTLYILWHAELLPFLDNSFINIPVLFGSHAAIVTAGMIAGQMIVEKKSTKKLIINWVLFGAIIYGLGTALRPWQIANKIEGTASWCMMTAGISLFGLAITTLLLETRVKRAFLWLAPIGSNAMLAYLLPDFFGKLMDASALWLVPRVGTESDSLVNLWNVFWPFWNEGGAAGLANALVMTLFVGAIAGWLSIKKVRLKL